jgi:hypothetical protein
MQNIGGKKRASPEDADSDYLFANVSQRSAFRSTRYKGEPKPASSAKRLGMSFIGFGYVAVFQGFCGSTSHLILFNAIGRGLLNYRNCLLRFQYGDSNLPNHFGPADFGALKAACSLASSSCESEVIKTSMSSPLSSCSNPSLSGVGLLLKRKGLNCYILFQTVPLLIVSHLGFSLSRQFGCLPRQQHPHTP